MKKLIYSIFLSVFTLSLLTVSSNAFSKEKPKKDIIIKSGDIVKAPPFNDEGPGGRGGGKK